MINARIAILGGLAVVVALAGLSLSRNYNTPVATVGTVQTVPEATRTNVPPHQSLTADDIEAMARAAERLAIDLDALLKAVSGTAEVQTLRAQMLVADATENEYVIARLSGADASKLREIATRYAQNADAMLKLWDSDAGAISKLRRAQLQYQDASWDLFHAEKSGKAFVNVNRKLSQAVKDWMQLDGLRNRVSVNIGWDLREAMKKLTAQGDSTDEAARQRELLKVTIVFLESSWAIFYFGD